MTWLRFAIVAAILLSAALFLQGAIAKFDLHFRKLPVLPAKPLLDLGKPAPGTTNGLEAWVNASVTSPADKERLLKLNRLGSWVQVTTDEPLPTDLQAALGATEYSFRGYIDTRAFTARRVAMMTNPAGNPQRAFQMTLAGLDFENGRDTPTLKDNVIYLMLTYHTGMVDTVAHIPDRCYIADGKEVSEATTMSLPILPNGAKVDVRYLNFVDRQVGSRHSTSVAYFFHVNGKWASNPQVDVRREMQDLTRRHMYYMKIEMKTLHKEQPDAERVMTRFLQDAIPHITTLFPDLDALEKGQSPTTRPATPPTTAPAAK